MITFKQFIHEAAEDAADYKTTVTKEDALRILKSKCKNALKTFDQPIWRGTKSTKDDFVIIDSTIETKKSANTSNHYTVIFDHTFKGTNIPPRSESIICGNDANFDYARGYGHIYAIFPFDNAKIGYIDASDLWALRVDLPKESFMSLCDINDFVFDTLGISDKSWKDLISSSGMGKLAKRWDLSVPEVIAVIEKTYSPEALHIHGTTTADPKYNGKKSRELWVSGKSVAIEYSAYHKLAKAWSEGNFWPEHKE